MHRMVIQNEIENFKITNTTKTRKGSEEEL